MASASTAGSSTAAEAASPLVATCHCGRVKITVPSVPEYLNECLCSLCYKYGVSWAYYKPDAVQVQVTTAANGGATDGGVGADGKSSEKAGTASVSVKASAVPLPPGLHSYVRYDCGLKGDNSFNRCSHCGCVTHWTFTAHSRWFGHPDAEMGVNSRMFPKDALEGVERRVEEGPEDYPEEGPE